VFHGPPVGNVSVFAFAKEAVQQCASEQRTYSSRGSPC
jgi:hypothetical protein